MVVFAGGIVRMTGSGMGCPDWPKCFGYVIPPISHSQLEWKSNHHYKKGQIIIVSETLKVAKKDFKTGSFYLSSSWKNYEKHNYAKFNATHTWIEFINRLLGALAGIFIFIMGILSFGFLKKKKIIVLFSWVTIFLVGFQGWLGKTVVDSLLLPKKVTLHLFVALIIVCVLLFLLSATQKTQFVISKQAKKLSIACLFITFVQIVLGTQVRQLVDSGHLTIFQSSIFHFHRGFSVLVVFTNILLLLKLKKKKKEKFFYAFIIAIIGLEASIGMNMFYFKFPFSTQPLHLLAAFLIFGLQFYFITAIFKNNKSMV